jgi:hypothetical protein
MEDQQSSPAVEEAPKEKKQAKASTKKAPAKKTDASTKQK